MFKVHSGNYSGDVAQNTDMLALLNPANLPGFKIIGFKVNTSTPAIFQLNDIDTVLTWQVEYAGNYECRVNTDTPDFFIDITQLICKTACTINGMVFYCTIDESGL